MDKTNFNFSADWVIIEDAVSSLWPEKWFLLNSIEVKELESIIEQNLSLDSQCIEVSGGMSCEFSIVLQDMYNILSITYILVQILDWDDYRLKQKIKEEIEKHDQEVRDKYQKLLDQKIDKLIAVLRKKIK